MLKTKRWSRITYERPGLEAFSFEVRRMPHGEAVAFLAETQVMVDFQKQLEFDRDEKGEIKKVRFFIDGQPATQDQWDTAYYKLTPPAPRVREIIAANVRDVRDLEEDGVAITTGEALADFADPALTVFVLMRLHDAIRLSVQEGKASSSPSTSSPGAETPAGE